jgi:hypothetical protein
MELRFVEGNFKHGKFKLQMGKEVEPDRIEWIDFPCVKEEPEIPLDSGIELIKRIRACFGFSLGEAKRWYDHMRFWADRGSSEAGEKKGDI